MRSCVPRPSFPPPSPSPTRPWRASKPSLMPCSNTKKRHVIRTAERSATLPSFRPAVRGWLREQHYQLLVRHPTRLARGRTIEAMRRCGDRVEYAAQVGRAAEEILQIENRAACGDPNCGGGNSEGGKGKKRTEPQG